MVEISSHPNPLPRKGTVQTTSMLYVILDGETAIASREANDGSPETMGIGLCGILRHRDDIDLLRKYIPLCRTVTSDMIKEQRVRNRYGWENGFKVDHPDYSDLSGTLLLREIIERKGNILLMRHDEDRRLDDWAYVVDMDSEMMEVHRGFNMARVFPGERFYDGPNPNTSGFYPFRQLFSFGFDNIPTDEEFMERCRSGMRIHHLR